MENTTLFLSIMVASGLVMVTVYYRNTNEINKFTGAYDSHTTSEFHKK
jgi:hypothetical protein